MMGVWVPCQFIRGVSHDEGCGSPDGDLLEV